MIPKGEKLTKFAVSPRKTFHLRTFCQIGVKGSIQNVNGGLAIFFECEVQGAQQARSV